jgi:hypothetical protein
MSRVFRQFIFVTRCPDWFGLSRERLFFPFICLILIQRAVSIIYPRIREPSTNTKERRSSCSLTLSALSGILLQPPQGTDG